MNRLALVVLVAACGSDDKPAAPAVATPAPKETITAQLAGCTKALPQPADPRELVVTDAIRQQLPPARVVLGTPAVTGALEVDLVRTILRRHLAKFQRCYETRLLAEPDTADGVVETAFAIQPSGHVGSPTADGIDREVAKCFATALQSVGFPAPRDGNQVQVSVQIEVKHTRAAPDATGGRPVFPPAIRNEWTPFAFITQPEASVAQTVEGVTTAVRDRLSSIDRCFDGARGVVRAMIELNEAGHTEKLRIGGIGETAIEGCVEKALAGITVNAGPPVEIACDVTRGGDAPLRVSPDAGYTVIELTAREARNDSSVRELPPRGRGRSVTAIGAKSAVLVVAEPDAPARGIDYALWWAPPAATLISVKASGGAPVFLGMGDSRAERQAATEKRVVQLRTDGGRMRACIPGEQLDASAVLLDPKQMDAVMKVVKSACERQACEPTIVVGTSGDFIAKDLVATTSAARRAGFAQISIGGPACN